jgi:hypothetical protein
MRSYRVTALLLALTVWPGAALAQFPPPPPPPGPPPPVRDRWPEAPKPQAAPRPPAPQPQARPKLDGDSATAPAKKPPAKSQQARTPAHVVVCGGVFAKDSTHLKLAMRFDSRNIIYGDVDGPDGSKLKASILFPNDPRRRLEVLWDDEASRSGLSVIAINGRSQWVAPRGLKLGLALAALEKANARPFKLSGFGPDGHASVTGWEGGALSKLPGDCKVGLRLIADAKAPAEARQAVTGAKEFLSNDATVRSVRPTVGEILIGY